MPLVISAADLATLYAAARASPAREICGLLFGTDERVASIVATANVAADPTTAFEIDPAALVAAHRAERSGGPRLIGCYHSHPSGTATPSASDAAAAEPGRVWIILALGEARAWRAGELGFVEVSLVDG